MNIDDFRASASANDAQTSVRITVDAEAAIESVERLADGLDRVRSHVKPEINGWACFSFALVGCVFGVVACMWWAAP